APLARGTPQGGSGRPTCRASNGEVRPGAHKFPPGSNQFQVTSLPCHFHVTHSLHFTAGKEAHCSYNRAERYKTFLQQRTAIKAAHGSASGKVRLRRKTNKVCRLLPVNNVVCAATV